MRGRGQGDEGSNRRNRAFGIQKSSNRFSALALASAFALVGCATGTLEDPNDVAAAGPETPKVIMAQLKAASESLNLRKAKREINDRQYRRLMVNIARDYIGQAKDTTITDDNAAAWARVYMSARDWKAAEPALQHVVDRQKDATTADFKALGDWVGNSLSLASAQAHLGKVRESMATTRSVFKVVPKAKAPILTSMLYDIVPYGYRKGFDMELAELLKEGIKQHEQVIVDPNTDGGRDFLLARPHHIRRAWEEVAMLYSSAGRRDLAQEALEEAHRADSVPTPERLPEF